MKAKKQDTIVYTEEQKQAIRAERRRRIRQRDYRERGAALYAIAMTMLRQGVSAVEAQANKNDRARISEIRGVSIRIKGLDMDIDESMAIGLIQTPIEILLEDVDEPLAEPEPETSESLADHIEERDMVTRMRKGSVTSAAEDEIGSGLDDGVDDDDNNTSLFDGVDEQPQQADPRDLQSARRHMLHAQERHNLILSHIIRK